jgi:flagellar biogenesis protein FliO
MGADEIVMLVGLGVALLIVAAWLWTVFRMRGQRGLEQENPPRMDATLFPWSRGNGGRW